MDTVDDTNDIVEEYCDMRMAIIFFANAGMHSHGEFALRQEWQNCVRCSAEDRLREIANRFLSKQLPDRSTMQVHK